MNLKKLICKIVCVIIWRFWFWYFIGWKIIPTYFDLWHFEKNFDWCKPLHIIFNQLDRFIRVYDGIRYLVLFGCEKYHAIYNRIRHLISQTRGITYIFLIIMRKKIDSYDSLPLEKHLLCILL